MSEVVRGRLDSIRLEEVVDEQGKRLGDRRLLTIEVTGPTGWSVATVWSHAEVALILIAEPGAPSLTDSSKETTDAG